MSRSIASRLERAETALCVDTAEDSAAWLRELSREDLERLAAAVQSIEEAREAGEPEPEDALQIVIELMQAHGLQPTYG